MPTPMGIVPHPDGQKKVRRRDLPRVPHQSGRSKNALTKNYFPNLEYSSSVTGSSHSLEAFSPEISNAK